MRRTLTPQRFFAKTPLHLAILLFAAVWIIPTLGLLITSLRDPTNIAVLDLIFDQPLVATVQPVNVAATFWQVHFPLDKAAVRVAP